MFMIYMAPPVEDKQLLRGSQQQQTFLLRSCMYGWRLAIDQLKLLHGTEKHVSLKNITSLMSQPPK